MENGQNGKIGANILCHYSSSSEEDVEGEKETTAVIQNHERKRLCMTDSNSDRRSPPLKRHCSTPNIDCPKLPTKTPALPAVPSSIKSMYSDIDRLLNEPTTSSHDPRNHLNKIRSFPHVRGNWASSVFIKVPA